MKTKKQAALADSFLATLDDETAVLYRRIMDCLEELGYAPQKGKNGLSFKHALHAKQIAKMGMRTGKTTYPFFALRFSGCKGYSKRFEDIVEANIRQYPKKVSSCVDGGCHFCAGAPWTHVYAFAFPDGKRKAHCGAYALEIPQLDPEDMEEIEKLIREEHAYLLAQEVHGS